MAGVILLSFLAALGIVFLLVCVCGWLWLPADGDGYCVIRAAGLRDVRSVRAYLFLQRCGAIRLPLVVVDMADGLTKEMLPLRSDDAVCLISAQQWEEWEEMERSTGVFGT